MDNSHYDILNNGFSWYYATVYQISNFRLSNYNSLPQYVIIKGICHKLRKASLDKNMEEMHFGT